MNSQQEVKDVIQSFVGQVNMLTVPRPLVDFMDGDLYGGILLSQILYWSSRTNNEEGWFYKTYADWKEELSINEYQVRRVIKDLIKKGILKTKIKKANGNPTVHYLLLHDIFSESLLSFLSKESSVSKDGYCDMKGTKPLNESKEPLDPKVPITETTTKNTAKTTTKTTHTPSVCSSPKGFALSGEDTTQGNKEITYGRVATDKLYGSLQNKRKIMTRTTNLKQWSYQIDHFIDTSILTIDQFDEVLEWYIIHIGEQYVPKAYSAKSFCSEFVRISDAMDRDKQTEQRKGKTKAQIRYEEMEKSLEAKGII